MKILNLLGLQQNQSLHFRFGEVLVQTTKQELAKIVRDAFEDTFSTNFVLTPAEFFTIATACCSGNPVPATLNGVGATLALGFS